ncbi:LysR family transcriptional regulator [Rhodanobacter aciditrophus]|uniref:LysR family transcriptional regulator n=1 Tax=Rhodanobacter aciditrophus TaxID=1623218 RepID=A0ABW4B0N6_9GAMM
MEFFQLRCFVTVATELNFSKAAERLNMTQPPLSRQIQLLEHQLGVSLLTRTTRSVVLTAAGRAFLTEAKSLLERADRAAMSAKKIAAGDIGTVTLSFVPSAVYEFVPKVIANAHQQRPNIKISLAEMNSFEQQEAVRSRQVDLGIVRSAPPQPDLASQFLLSEPFVLALPRQHPLVKQPKISLADLHEQAFILYSHSEYHPFHELLSGMFRAARIAPNVVQNLGSTLTILSLVNANVGMALIPKSAAVIQFDQVVCRPIELPEGISSDLHLIWREDNDNPALISLLEDIQTSVLTP